MSTSPSTRRLWRRAASCRSFRARGYARTRIRPGNGCCAGRRHLPTLLRNAPAQGAFLSFLESLSEIRRATAALKRGVSLVRAHSLSLADLTALRSQHAIGTRRLRSVLAAFRRLRTGVLDVRVPGGECHTFQGACAGPHAQIELRDWNCAGEVLHLRTGSIQGYLAGAWDSADLPALLTLIELNPQIFPGRPRWSWWGARRALIARHVSANVHARYRLTNDFYRAWLDPSLTYSAAVFDAQPQRSLEQAQITKFEHILQALRPERGALLLDIGCGWGAFARHAAIHYGCRVHAITVSRRQ